MSTPHQTGTENRSAGQPGGNAGIRDRIAAAVAAQLADDGWTCEYHEPVKPGECSQCDESHGITATRVAAVLVPEFESLIPERIFTDDRGNTWEWCGGQPGTWAWRMTRIGEPDDRP